MGRCFMQDVPGPVNELHPLFASILALHHMIPPPSREGFAAADARADARRFTGETAGNTAYADLPADPR